MDRAIQMALREVDTRQLALALLHQNEENREPIYRNMSRRAVVLLKEEMQSLGSQTPENLCNHMLGNFLNRVKVFKGYVEENISSTPQNLPDPKWDSAEKLCDFLVSLKRYTNANGALSIDPLTKTGNLPPLLQQGIEMYTDGWDQAMAREILITLQESLIAAYRRDLSIELEGVLSLYSHDLPQVVERRLKNLIPRQ
jgi:flagellar motor component MotA